jgi:hypothetical protein
MGRESSPSFAPVRASESEDDGLDFQGGTLRGERAEARWW